ncbi:MAG: hypothetical protein PHS93_03725 [Candidatus Omnitrophica bacterium]|nr:hypothetical protein [Candidatus Omnitrophota bacterium]MDD5352261.1 hypothetical protein [Candidatus Omnitrophota bacterium]MDD5549859.1 hypothetical protein [Candidatus Omnitrophota bacterium]
MKKIVLIILGICVGIMVFTSLCLAGWEEDSEKATLEDEAAHLMRIEMIKENQNSAKNTGPDVLYRPITEFLITRDTKGVINGSAQNDAITAPDATTAPPGSPCLPPEPPPEPGGGGATITPLEGPLSVSEGSRPTIENSQEISNNDMPMEGEVISLPEVEITTTSKEESNDLSELAN